MDDPEVTSITFTDDVNATSEVVLTHGVSIDGANHKFSGLGIRLNSTANAEIKNLESEVTSKSNLKISGGTGNTVKDCVFNTTGDDHPYSAVVISGSNDGTVVDGCRFTVNGELEILPGQPMGNAGWQAVEFSDAHVTNAIISNNTVSFDGDFDSDEGGRLMLLNIWNTGDKAKGSAKSIKVNGNTMASDTVSKQSANFIPVYVSNTDGIEISNNTLGGGYAGVIISCLNDNEASSGVTVSGNKFTGYSGIFVYNKTDDGTKVICTDMAVTDNDFDTDLAVLSFAPETDMPSGGLTMSGNTGRGADMSTIPVG